MPAKNDRITDKAQNGFVLLTMWSPENCIRAPVWARSAFVYRHQLPTPMLIEGTEVFKKPYRDEVHSSLETRTAVKKIKQNAEDQVNGGNGTSTQNELQIICKTCGYLKIICKVL
ncbi:MAG TPA: hypothetical protein VNY29_04390 [Terriglobales bacterium]|nr:hypothetical protein [Terriglobales bacterium]